MHAAQHVARVLGEPLACDVLACRAEALEEGRRLAGVVVGVVGNDGLAHHGLGREADHEGEQGEYRRLLCGRLGGVFAAMRKS